MLGEVPLEKYCQETFHLLIGNRAQADLASLAIRNAPVDEELWVMRRCLRLSVPDVTLSLLFAVRR